MIAWCVSCISLQPSTKASRLKTHQNSYAWLFSQTEAQKYNAAPFRPVNTSRNQLQQSAHGGIEIYTEIFKDPEIGESVDFHGWRFEVLEKAGQRIERATQIGERRVGKECRSRWSPYH